MAPGRAIRRLGPRVLVLDPVPKPPCGVPGCLSVHLPKARAFTVPLDEGIDEAGLAAERGPVAAAGGTCLDTLPCLCTTTTCAVMVDNLLVHRDDNHLTDTYATCLAQAKTDELAVVLGLRPSPMTATRTGRRPWTGSPVPD
ncbi:MAG TPA: SGNH hydrolase domain-containing protein [Acidimicrobiales bacterium]|nr:SGNH hydrolase domain-containing protein [Acidimicrobiales bacterium]